MSPTAHSEDFEHFMASVNAPLDSRDAIDRFDLEALNRLVGAERDEAEQLLTNLLDRADARVPAALAALGSKRAVGALKHALGRHTGVVKVSIAEALWELGQDPTALDALVDVLGQQDIDGRVWAVHALQSFDLQRADDALLAALRDPDEVVRLGAADSLFTKLGLEPYTNRKRGKLNMLRVRLQSTLDSVRDPAIAELTVLASKLRSGGTPGQLGLSKAGDVDNPAAQRFINSYLDPDGKSFDLEAIRTLTGDERAFADDMLAYFAERGDARAFEAIVEVRATTAIPALEELSRRSDPAAKQAAVALARIRK